MKNFKLPVIMLLLSALMLGCSCKKADESTGEEYIPVINSALSDVNGESRLSGEYLTEIKMYSAATEPTTLYYMNGEAAWDREAMECEVDFTNTFYGTTFKAQNYYKNGDLITVCDGDAYRESRDGDALFAMFPYCALPLYDNECCKNIKKAVTKYGDSYIFLRTDTKEICDMTVGTDLYDLTRVISAPQKDKTVYGDTTCVVVINEGKAVSARFEFDVKLFDTPPYNPNQTEDISKYTYDLHITARISFDKRGENVVIDEYSGDVTDAYDE